MSFVEQSYPFMPYYSPPIPYSTSIPTRNTRFDGGLPSANTPAWFQSYQPAYPLDPHCPAATTFSPYGCDYLTTVVPTRMPSSSWMPAANCMSPIDVLDAPHLHPDFHRVGADQAFNGLGSGCFSAKGLIAATEKVGSKDLKGHLSSPGEWSPEAMTAKATQLASVGLASDHLSADSARLKRSRAAQACKRCRFRKAKCFGGNPCNRCTKLNLKSAVQDVHLSHQDQHNILPHAHTHNPAHALSFTCAHGDIHCHCHKYKARPQFIHSVNAGPTTVAVVPSALGRVPTHTDFCRSQTPAPAGGLGLELNPSMDEEADRESDWHGGNPAKSPLSASNSAFTISGLSGFGADAMLTCSKADFTLHPLSAERPGGGELQVYRSMVDDDTFQLSLRAASGTSDDVYGVDQYPSTPILSTIPLPAEPHHQ